MIDAGGTTLMDNFDPEAPGWERDVVVKIFGAMWRASLGHAHAHSR